MPPSFPSQQVDKYRVNFRIKPSDDVAEELDRLARILSQKYKREVRIFLEDAQRHKP